MHIEQKMWTNEEGWKIVSPHPLTQTPQLVLVFGATHLVRESKYFDDIKKQYPSSHIIMMSSAGEIADTRVSDNSLSLVALNFEKTSISCVETHVADMSDSEKAGIFLAKQLVPTGLTHVLVFSDGIHVNGTNLVKGLTSVLPPTVAVTGGLVGDGADFKHTYLGLDAYPSEGTIVAVGLYGESLQVRYGSRGGWDAFGPERVVTRSKDNVLYELDGRPALEIYKEYLGDRAKDLPSSGLLFPLNITIKDPKTGQPEEVVRTILSIHEEEKSLVFAGTIPQGVGAQMMRANFDRLITGAADAALLVSEGNNVKPQFALLVSCVGRKLVLKERIEEEIEAIRDALGPDAVIAGFYSYGEISPLVPTEKQCLLHNQTMTITTFAEV